MKEVDLRKMLGKVSPKYAGISQPMMVYHSIKEFKEHVIPTSPILIRDIGNFQEYLKRYDLLGKNTYANVSSSNVWIATGEKFIPDFWTPKGVIMWKMKNNQLIPTDNCFIQLFYLYSGSSNYMIYTSSGVYNISINKWFLSAAVKDQFLREHGFNSYNLGGQLYQENIKKFFDKKMTSVRDVRAFHCLFNPFSDTFMQPDKTIKRVFGGQIHAKDRMKFYETNRFRRIFIKEMRTLMPDLKNAFQTHIKDKDMVDMALKLFNNAADKGTTEDGIKIYDMIYQLRETEKKVVPAFERVGEATPTPILGNKEVEKVTPAIETYEEAEVVKIVEEKPKGKTPSLTDEEIEELREETGALEGYVIPDAKVTSKT